MPTIPFAELAHVSTLNSFGASTSDVRLLAAHRYGDTVVVGCQVVNAIADLDCWNDANYPGSRHQDSSYWGFWGAKSAPMRATAGQLEIIGATLEGEPRIARVTAAVALVAQWGLRWGSTVTGPVTWAWRLCNASTGAATQSGTFTAPVGQTTMTANLTGLTSGSYLLWVWISGAAKPYHWPPDDYASVTGNSAAPLQYSWEHPTLGVLYYDPVWNVGARPYDEDDETQLNLLELRTQALARGAVRKHPQWADNLTEFDADGLPVALRGEYACLRIQAGVGAWLGDTACHVNASPGPALLTLAEGVATPLVLSPALRGVGAFYTQTEGDELLVLGGMASGREGREIALVISDLEALEPGAGGLESVAGAVCICARSSEAAGGVVRHPDNPDTGVMYLLGSCGIWKYDPAAGEYLQRLTETEPGGVSLVQACDALGNERMAWTVESDFAGSHLRTNFCYLMTQDGRGDRFVSNGPGHMVESSLAVYLGRVWCIEQVNVTGELSWSETAAQQALATQYLSYFDGADLVRVASWPQGVFDGGRLCRAGKALLLFGQAGEDRAPAAMRFDGRELTRTPLTLDYWVHHATPTPQGTALCVAQKAVDGATDGSWYVVETSGDSGAERKTCFEWNSGAGEFRVLTATAVGNGLVLAAMPPFLAWIAVANEEAGGHWEARDAQPGSGTYLVFEDHTTFWSYDPNTSMPYDTAIWGRLCGYTGDGTWEKPIIESTCTDPACVYEEGMTVVVMRVPAVGQSAAVNALRIRDEHDLQEICSDLPALWVRSDPTTTFDYTPGDVLDAGQLAELATFTERLHYGELNVLATPARGFVEVVVLVPSGSVVAPVVGREF